VSKYVGRDLFAMQRRTFSICRFGVTPQNVRDSPPAEGFTASVHKELGRCDRTANGQPGTEGRSRCFPKRQRTFATALATNADAHRLGCDIVGAQPCQLRDSESSAHRKMQHGPVSNPLPRGWIGSVEQGLHFFLDQMRHQTSVGFLEGDSQNTAHLPDCGWLTVLQKPEERPNGSQADVSRLR
jgi:hypothetical protein